jgi:hypothetical protein
MLETHAPHQKTAGSPIRAPLFNPAGRSQLMIAGMFGYTEFTPIGPGVYARAMQYEFLFIFQKGIRAAIE